MSFALGVAWNHRLRPGGEVKCAVVVRPFQKPLKNVVDSVGWHVRPNGVKGTVRIYRDEEGIWWARGWRTKEADAFRTTVALSP